MTFDILITRTSRGTFWRCLCTPEGSVISEILGVDGIPIEFLYFDTPQSADAAKQAYESIIESRGYTPLFRHELQDEHFYD